MEAAIEATADQTPSIGAAEDARDTRGLRAVPPLTPPEPVYMQAARRIRERIYDGTYSVRVGSAPELAAEFGCTIPVIVQAFRVLRAEGLIRTAPGDATYVLPRFVFTVAVTVPGPDAGSVRLAAFRSACRDAERADPAVTGIDVHPLGPVWRWTVRAECADVGRAAALAVAAVRPMTDDRWQWGKASLAATAAGA